MNDLKKYADSFAPLQRYLYKQNGNLTLCYGDKNALRELTRAILWADFGLTLNLASENLVPAVQSRLDYISFIKSLVNSQRQEKIVGVDIGCGASCIYPLLISKLYPQWKMMCTEIPSSFELAEQNILENKAAIKLIPAQLQGSLLPQKEINELPNDSFLFTMCNPPFYSSYDDIARSKALKQSMDDRELYEVAGIAEELVCSGGEVQFIKQMIQDSLQVENKNSLFTSLVGHKINLRLIKDYIATLDLVKLHSTFAIQQARTKRWIVVWQVLD